MVRGPRAELVLPTELFQAYLRTWFHFQPLSAEMCSDMCIFGISVTAIECLPGAIEVPVRLHPLLCQVKIHTKNGRLTMKANGDFDETIKHPMHCSRRVQHGCHTSYLLNRFRSAATAGQSPMGS
eukprot:1429297-Prymnesium_polylepis.1